MAEPVVKVSRGELAQALRLLAKLIGKHSEGETLLFSSGGYLTLASVGGSARIPAEGRWDGQVRIRNGVILALAKVLPKHDPVVLALVDGRLKIGPSSFQCTWQPTQVLPIEVPTNAQVVHILGLAHKHSAEEIERSGLAATLADARKRKEAMLDVALDALKPLGVDYADLLPVVDAAIRRANGLS